MIRQELPIEEGIVFKIIPGHPNYAAGDNGSIFSKRSPNSRWKELTQQCAENGYLRVMLYPPKRWFPVHRLVAMAFIGMPEEDQVINHKNGIKDDNVPENLEWVTKSENMLHAYKTGLQKSICGEEHHNAYLSDEEVRSICKRYEEGESQRSIAKDLGISQQTVSDYCRGSRRSTAKSQEKE